MIFITHDLSTLAAVCQRLAVMYAGRIVEEGPSHEVFAAPAHPYTAALAAAFPVIGDPRFRMAPSGPRRATRPIRGELPDGLPVPSRAARSRSRRVRDRRRRAVAGRRRAGAPRASRVDRSATV